jgi:hypothetical protein
MDDKKDPEYYMNNWESLNIKQSRKFVEKVFLTHHISTFVFRCSSAASKIAVATTIFQVNKAGKLGKVFNQQ